MARRQRQTWRERKGSIGPLQKCMKPECPVVLRFGNVTGYCQNHVYLRYLAGPSGLTCGMCGAPLRRDNRHGLCLAHRGRREHVKVRVDYGSVCVVPGCVRFRLATAMPLCQGHLGEWHDSLQLRGILQIVERFLRTAASPGAPIPQYSQAELRKMADALLGEGFGKDGSNDAWHRHVYIGDRAKVARQMGLEVKEVA